jgi:hypothetical protein
LLPSSDPPLAPPPPRLDIEACERENDIQHDNTFLPNMQEAKLKIGKISDLFWWGTWFLFMSKKQIDRDDMRDLLLSKLPVAKLFTIGCVPQYNPYLFNAHINPFMEHQLKHNK